MCCWSEIWTSVYMVHYKWIYHITSLICLQIFLFLLVHSSCVFAAMVLVYTLDFLLLSQTCVRKLVHFQLYLVVTILAFWGELILVFDFEPFFPASSPFCSV